MPLTLMTVLLIRPFIVRARFSRATSPRAQLNYLSIRKAGTTDRGRVAVATRAVC